MKALFTFVIIGGLLLAGAYWASQNTDISQRVHRLQSHSTPAPTSTRLGPGQPIPADGP